MIDVHHMPRYIQFMIIRTREELLKHIARVRKPRETDSALAARIGIHQNTMTKLKQTSAMFETVPYMEAVGLRVVYETVKEKAVQA